METYANVAKAMKSIQSEDAKQNLLKNMRKSLVNSMLIGNIFAIDLEEAGVDFKENLNHAQTWPSDKIFDFMKWRDCYDDYVQPHEKVSVGGKEMEKLPLNPNFSICVISKAETEEEMMASIWKIPHISQFKKVIIN